MQLIDAQSYKRAQRFMQRFREEHSESPKHPEYARWRMAAGMMTDCTVITKPNGDPFCGVSRYRMEYVVATGHDVFTIS